MINTDKSLILVDGSSLAFRSFYALFNSSLKSKDGTPTGAIYGFFTSLLDLIEKNNPHSLAVCFDLAKPTFRHKRYEAYKANRSQMPEELSLQWPIIKDGVARLNIPLLELAGYEADDIIGTLTNRANQDGLNVNILTGDQDAFQLIVPADANSPTAPYSNLVLMPSKTGLIFYDYPQVLAKLGVYPSQIIDYKALCGDSSDNIPGIRGIGPKTACELLVKYKNLDNIYENLDNITKKTLKDKLIDQKDNAYLSQFLATIDVNIPLEQNSSDLIMDKINYRDFHEYLQNLNMKNLIKRIPVDVLPPPSVTGQLSFNFDANSNTISNTNNVTPTPIFLPLMQPENLNPQIINDEINFAKLLTKLNQNQVICVDLETTGLDTLNTSIVGIAIAFNEDVKVVDKQIVFAQNNENLLALPVETYYIPLMHQTGEIQLAQDYVLTNLKPILENSQIFKIAQNAKFEMNVLANYHINFAPLIFDPMLASYIENTDNRHGLKDQSLRIFDHQMTPIDSLIGTGKKQITMANVAVNTVAFYACDDARITLLLSLYYQEKLAKTQLDLLQKMEIPLTSVLATMEQDGVCINIEYLQQLSGELTKDLNSLEESIYRFAGYAFNINSTQQLQKVLFQDLGLKTKAKTKTGFSTDFSVLESLQEAHEIIPKLINYRQIQKLLSTYVDALPKLVKDTRVHCQFNQVITSTGRLSSSNPNLQNIPIKTSMGRKIRQAFKAQNDDDFILSADYSQIELRILAHMSQDPNLIEAFKQNLDIHLHTAAKIFDVDINDVTKEMRTIGKTLNFALIYQQGAYSTAKDLNISLKEANQFIEKYFSQYPLVKDYLNSIIQEAKKNGYVTTLWGRRRYFKNINDSNEFIRKASERAACNAPIQGSAADLIKLAMIELRQNLQRQNLKSKLILQVHDELVLEVLASEIDEVKLVVEKSMLLNQPLLVPLKIDLEIGKTWLD